MKKKCLVIFLREKWNWENWNIYFFQRNFRKVEEWIPAMVGQFTNFQIQNFKKIEKEVFQKLQIHHIIVEPFLKTKSQHSFLFFPWVWNLISSLDSWIFNSKINIQNMKWSSLSQFITYWSNRQPRPQES